MKTNFKRYIESKKKNRSLKKMENGASNLDPSCSVITFSICTIWAFEKVQPFISMHSQLFSV